VQTRGPQKHLKRLNAPHHWMLSKLDGIWAPKPGAGPHKGRESLPLVLIVRNRLKYALTRSEAQAICMRRLVSAALPPPALHTLLATDLGRRSRLTAALALT
jgi:ribosomal protein S4E